MLQISCITFLGLFFLVQLGVSQFWQLSEEFYTDTNCQTICCTLKLGYDAVDQCYPFTPAGFQIPPGTISSTKISLYQCSDTTPSSLATFTVGLYSDTACETFTESFTYHDAPTSFNTGCDISHSETYSLKVAGTRPACGCGSAPVPPLGVLPPSCSSYAFQATCSFSCDSGYTGGGSFTCGADGTWSQGGSCTPTVSPTSTLSPTTSPTPTSSTSSSGISVGAIVGIIVGGCVLLILICILCFSSTRILIVSCCKKICPCFVSEKQPLPYPYPPPAHYPSPPDSYPPPNPYPPPNNPYFPRS